MRLIGLGVDEQVWHPSVLHQCCVTLNCKSHREGFNCRGQFAENPIDRL
jgi:hypothetical protein